MAQPLVALLAQADAGGSIDALAPPHIAAVMQAMPGVDTVLETTNRHGKLDLRMRWRTARALAARRYDRAFVLPNSFKSALIPFLAGIRQRVGYRGEARHLLLNRLHHAPERARASDEPDGLEATRTPMVEHYAQLALAPGQTLAEPVPDPVLRGDKRASLEAKHRLGLPDDPIIVLAPGAEYGPAKRWPARHFAALAHLISDEWPEATIVLLGAARERTLATEIIALSGLALRNLCGETSMQEAIALIADAQGVVSNDSGLMHVAAALGRPQVALFGSSDPRHTPPRSARARVLWLHLPCSPCFSRSCPLGHTNCLNDILPPAAFAALDQVMRQATTAGR